MRNQLWQPVIYTIIRICHRLFVSHLKYFTMSSCCEPICKMDPKPLKIGIIGGSGLDDPDLLENRKELFLSSPFGSPSDALIEGDIKGVKCYLLARHGRKHDIMPSNVNYRANIWALREIGCTHILVTNACGSLREYIKRGDLVVPNDFIDRTTRRISTFYDGNASSPRGVLHMPMCPAFSEELRKVLIDAATQLDIPVFTEGTIVCIEGPRYSSRAESRMFQNWGGDIIGMTTMPEAALAKEAGLLYASIALATDYDSWRDDNDNVHTEGVLKTFRENIEKVKTILVLAVQKIAEINWSTHVMEAKSNVMDNFISKPKQ